MTHSSLSRVTDTRIEGRVQHVDNEVAHYENQHEQRDDGHHQVCLALQNGLVGEEADAVDVEDLLGDHGTTHQGADVLAEVSDDWNQGVT